MKKSEEKAFVEELNELCKKYKTGLFAGEDLESGSIKIFFFNKSTGIYKICRMEDGFRFLKNVGKK